jgi:dUTP pyrophosphatase
MNKIKVKVKKVHQKAIIPKYQSDGASGFDFHALIDNKVGYVILEPKSQAIIRTGISFSIPENYEVQVRPRSGLAFKSEITITNSPGTLDSDFTIPNEILIIVYNLSNKSVVISDKDRIAQGVLQFVPKAEFVKVFSEDDEDKNRNRGGGFGSTGQ